MNMKKFISIVSIMLVVALLACVLIACGDDNEGGNNGGTGNSQTTHVDYVSQLKLDLNSTTAKFVNVTVKNYVDGDTTHFNVDGNVIPGGVLKARYLAINTPESTGKIEPYGHKASRFTKEKLKSAVSIVIESDGATWEADSTGSRYLTWVWYKPSEGAEYRNLNVEILQEGLAIGSNTANNRYGEIAFSALNQAKAEKLNCHSGVADPEVYAGDAIAVTLQELRCNITEYNNKKVAVEGIVARDSNNGIYLESEEADADTGLRSGIYCYYGFNLSGTGLEILSVGNKVKVVGTVQYYETGNTYQISDMSYRQMKPNDPSNLQRLDDESHDPAYQAIDVNEFVNGTVYYEYEDEEGAHTMSVKYAEYIMDTTVSLDNLKVTKVYTTTNEESSSKGAMTLTCTVGSQTITVRTDVLYDADGKLITESAYMGKTISIKGVVAYFNGYQVKVLSAKDITVLD